MKSTTLLLEDHKNILRVLKVLEEMTANVEASAVIEADDIDDIKDILTFLDGFGDRVHQGREESILFPALLTDRGQRHYKELCHLIFEHNRQRFLSKGIQDSVIGRNTKEFVYCARRMIKILREHIQDEETTLFPLVHVTISSATDEIIVRDMNAYESLWRHEELPGLLRRIEQLEAKYVAKVRHQTPG
jgi:hemerythrin-like domain-containing protein